MPALVWLAIALAAAVGAYLVGWPAYRAQRARGARDLNAERYLAWRGRAPRSPSPAIGGRLSVDERRRLAVALALAVVALISLVTFFVVG